MIYFMQLKVIDRDIKIKLMFQLILEASKVFVTDTYNTLEKAQIEKLSFASEKGDKIFGTY